MRVSLNHYFETALFADSLCQLMGDFGLLYEYNMARPLELYVEYLILDVCCHSLIQDLLICSAALSLYQHHKQQSKHMGLFHLFYMSVTQSPCFIAKHE